MKVYVYREIFHDDIECIIWLCIVNYIIVVIIGEHERYGGTFTIDTLHVHSQD